MENAVLVRGINQILLCFVNDRRNHAHFSAARRYSRWFHCLLLFNAACCSILTNNEYQISGDVLRLVGVGGREAGANVYTYQDYVKAPVSILKFKISQKDQIREKILSVGYKQC